MKNFPRNPAVNGTPAREIIPINIAKARKGERLANPSKSVNLFPGLLGHNYQHCKAKQRHEQVCNEVITYG